MPVGIYEHKRKYQKVTGWWVYIFKTPNNMYYVGTSHLEINHRKHHTGYRKISLEPFINKYGWDNLRFLMVKDNLTEQEARELEDRLICMYKQIGCCINKRRSGWIEKQDVNAYNKMRDKIRRSKPERKIYNRVYQFNLTHTPIETPSEAKQKYLQWGYIPDYIKSDDL